MRALQTLLFSLSFSLVAGPAWSLEFAGQRLQAVDRAEACYLVFIRLYQATLYSDEQGQTRCVDLEYRRPFSREELSRATLEFYADLYGPEAGSQDADELQRLVDAYQGVDSGDRYSFCLSPEYGAELARDGNPVMKTERTDFGQRLLGLWVEDFDPQGRARWSFNTCQRAGL